MKNLYKPVVGIILGLIAVTSITAQAQTPPRFLTLLPPTGLPVIPVLEGWVANEDGSRSFSYGIINRNNEAVDIPLGTQNYIEPAEYNGMQPTHFPAGRSTGVFTVTVPADKASIDVWWYLQTTPGGEVLKVPGRAKSSAYELDFLLPRPQGSLQPLVGLGESGRQAAGLMAMLGDYPGTVQVGSPVVLTVNVKDPSIRDTTDTRFKEPLLLGVKFVEHQGPGKIEFSKHESTEVAEPPDENDPRARFYRPPGANEVTVKGGQGIARVYATFSAPGEYLIRATVIAQRAPDSGFGDQCCWTNVFQRVNVRP